MKALPVLIIMLATACYSSGAELLHIRNEKSSPSEFLIDGIDGIKSVTLAPKESLSIRLPNANSIIQVSGTSSKLPVIIIEANDQSHAYGLIAQSDSSGYPIKNKIISVSHCEHTIKIREP